MKCSKCGREFPSRYYFADARTCMECHRGKPAAGPEPPAVEASRFEVAGLPLECPHCMSDRFTKRRVVMNDPARSLFGAERSDDAAEAYACRECGHVLWFLGPAG
jgi:DNA-directed RNA polymerase subunit RPC12/RpoP